MKVLKIGSFSSFKWETVIPEHTISVVVTFTGTQKLFIWNKIIPYDFGQIRLKFEDQIFLYERTGYIYSLNKMLNNHTPIFKSNWGILKRNRKYKLTFKIPIEWENLWNSTLKHEPGESRKKTIKDSQKAEIWAVIGNEKIYQL